MNNIASLPSAGDPGVKLSQAMKVVGDRLTIEAWVRLAPTGRAATLYPVSGYEGSSISLKAGLYRDLKQYPLPGLGSVRLPELMEAVLFSKPDFRGSALALQGDRATIPQGRTECGSLVVINRNGRRQDCVVLFEAAQFEGRAHVLELAQTWHPLAGTGLGHVGSAWVPPGAVIVIEQVKAKRGKIVETLYAGHYDRLPNYETHITALRRSKNDVASKLPAGVKKLKEDGVRSESWAGILTQASGAGLAVDQRPGELKGAPEELRFGSRLLGGGTWYHLARVYDKKTVRSFFNGVEVEPAQGDAEPAIPTGKKWSFGQGLRGQVARLRVWDKVRTPDQIRADRFAAKPDGAPVLDLFAALNEPGSLPTAPQDTALYQQMLGKAMVEHQQQMLVARHKAADQLKLAQERSQRNIALARDKARRDIHLKGIEQLGFVRGEDVFIYKASTPPGVISFNRDYEHIYTDSRGYRKMIGIAWTGMKKQTVYAADAGWASRIYAYRDQTDDRRWGAFELQVFGDLESAGKVVTTPKRICAVACDDSGNHPSARQGDVVRTAIYWITDDGNFYHCWDDGKNETPKIHLLSQQKLPIGRAEFWEMCVDTADGRQALIWSNGRELYRGTLMSLDGRNEFLGDALLVHVHIIVPHADSPYPIGVSTAPDGSVVWLDGEDEVVRMLPFDQKKKTFGDAKTLYSAPSPARGLSVCRLANDQKSDSETAFVYWASAERRTLEVPILDTPGRYVDLHYDPQCPHGQHVSVVPADEIAGARWQPETQHSSSNKVEDNDSPGGYLALSSAKDCIVLDPVRLTLGGGFTVEAELNWTGGAEDQPVCIYELSTFEDEDRIVCAIEPDGLPVLHLRWHGQDLAASGSRKQKKGKDQKKTRLSRWSPDDELATPQRVVWSLDGFGNVTTWIDGVKVHMEETDWRGGVEVFEGHRVGAPQPAQEHANYAGASARQGSLRRVFSGFTGRLLSFAAWNTVLPIGSDGSKKRLGPDLTWQRSLVTVESRRRYLRAGRLDQLEPPVTLFPLDIDGGLNIETKLDQVHAALTLAQHRAAAAEAHASQLKQEALDGAKQKLTAKYAELAKNNEAANTQVASARDDRKHKLEQSRSDRATADENARKRLAQGQQQAKTNKEHGQRKADHIRSKAAADKRSKVADANRRLKRARE